MVDVSQLSCPRINVLTAEEEKQLEGKSQDEILAFMARPEIRERTANSVASAFGVPDKGSAQ